MREIHYGKNTVYGKIQFVKMQFSKVQVRPCHLITPIKFLKGHKSLGSLLKMNRGKSLGHNFHKLNHVLNAIFCFRRLLPTWTHISLSVTSHASLASSLSSSTFLTRKISILDLFPNKPNRTRPKSLG